MSEAYQLIFPHIDAYYFDSYINIRLKSEFPPFLTQTNQMISNLLICSP